MSWTEDQIDRLRDKMALARRQGTWLSAAEVGLILTLIAAIKRITLSKGWNGAPSGLPPTIADARRNGVTGLFVTCDRCRSRRRLTFEDIGAPETTVFIEIPKARRFRCVRCGCRLVSVMADWPDPMKAQRAKTYGYEEDGR